MLTLGSIVAIWAPRKRAGPWTNTAGRLLALTILAGWAGEYIADAVEGSWSVQYTLPLQLTDAVSACAILALLTRRRLLVELTYFWAFTASLQATVTPDLGQNFPSVFYFTYFSYHVGAIVAACLLVFGLDLRPRPHAAWRAFALTLCFAAMVGIADVITDGNYMYLRTKPLHSSLLSVMGPWPWYIASTALLGLAMLLALQLIANRVPRGYP